MNIYVAKNGNQLGPFSIDQIRSMLASRIVQLSDLAWTDGLPDWQPLSTILPSPEMPPPISAIGSAVIAYAGFWRRFGAFVIDVILTNIAAFVVSFILGFFLASSAVHDQGSLGAIGAVAGLITTWLYYALLESSPLQATLGKHVFGIVVTDASSRRISFGRASARYWSMWISLLTLGIGFIMCAWTQRKQCLHDMIAGCVLPKRA